MLRVQQDLHAAHAQIADAQQLARAKLKYYSACEVFVTVSGADIYYYSLFGTLVSSPILLMADRLDRIPNDPNIGIKIIEGAVPFIENGQPHLDSGILCRAMGNSFLFGFDNEIRFSVTAGRDIVMQRIGDPDPDFVRLMLQGSPFGACLHQRGLLVLHGCTIILNDKAFVVIGPSGSGKSTLAVAMDRRGHIIQGDEVGAFAQDGDQFQSLPSFRHSKLWPDSAAYFEKDTSSLSTLWSGVEKYSVPLPALKGNASYPLGGVILLEPSSVSDISVRRVNGVERLGNLLRNVYRRGFLVDLGRAQQSYKLCAKVAGTIPMWHIQRPITPMNVNELALKIEELAQLEIVAT